MRSLSDKERGELNFWIDHVHGGGCRRDLGKSYAEQWSQGARGRLNFFKEQIAEIAEVEGGVWADVGCGPYPVLLHAPERTTAIMIDPLMKHYFHNRLLPPNAIGPRRVFLDSFIESLPLPDQTVDVVMCLNCLDHVEDPWAGLREMTRVLKVGGYFIIEVDVGGQSDYMHPHAFTELQFENKAREFGLTKIKGYSTDDKKRRPGAFLYYAFYRRTELNASVFDEPKAPDRALFHPVLVREGVNGFNIIRMPDIDDRDSYFALHQSEGAFSYQKAVSGGYGRCIQSDDLAKLMAQIEK